VENDILNKSKIVSTLVINMKLKTEDYYMYRGTSSNDLNSIQDTSESGETITWTNVERKLIFNVLNKSKIVSNFLTLLICFSSSILATEIPFILET
jgi:hypothetical protein